MQTGAQEPLHKTVLDGAQVKDMHPLKHLGHFSDCAGGDEVGSCARIARSSKELTWQVFLLAIGVTARGATPRRHAMSCHCRPVRVPLVRLGAVYAMLHRPSDRPAAYELRWNAAE